ncbi:MAG: (d)CMP kinase [Oscillospiraceae bacterium]|jgi:cytidylate kinase|nr:(d)CMP kinase [Oscillospiraceae bacterium]
MEKITRIAIDGPVGAGKSTIAEAAAKRLGFIHVDTGSLYRAIGVHCKENGCDVYDDSAVFEHIEKAGVDISLRFTEGEQRVFVNGADFTDKIRTPEASMLASRVSANPRVREFLLELQRSFALNNSVIMDGRDIGTVVLPEAEIKIFLTATPEERAKRRYDELTEKGAKTDYEEVLNDLNKRDYDDSHRASAPLKRADDAVLVDTTGNAFEQSVEEIVGLINEKFNR